MELAFAPGMVLLGKYRVESVLGRGGMGVVLRVTHLHLGEELAIKLLSPDGPTSAELGARFLREAQSAARLRGEHTARVVDVGLLLDGLPYMVMEYLRGADLAHQLQLRGTLPPGEAVDYVLQACEALAEAHAQGIVHRDIKPANLFLTTRPDGTPMVKVLDFGISKAPITNHALTKTDIVMGTAGYMSPEQMKAAKDVDARTDIWALGVVLYECLCGRPPFSGESFSAVVLMAGTEPPPPMDARVPRGLQQAVLRCLEKDRKARFPSIAALVSAIAPFARDRRAAATIVERANSMLARVPLAAEVAPSGPHPGQEPTTVHHRGQVTASPPKPSSAARWGVVGGVALVAIVAGAALLGSSTAPQRTRASGAGVSAASGVATILVDASSSEDGHGARPQPSPALVEAASPPPTSPAVAARAPLPAPPADAPSNAPSPVTPTAPAPSQTPERCTALRAARKWQDLLACGKALSDQGVANGADVQQIAQKELKNERVAREIQNKITSGSRKDARTALRQLSQDSVYVHELGQMLERAELAFVQEQARQANSLLAARECNALSDLLSRLTTSGDSAGRAAAEVNAIYAKCVTAAAPVITASAPPPPVAPAAPRPGCEPALIEDWTQQAANQFSNGYAQSALALVVRAVNCKPDVRLYRFAATFACAAHNVALAKLYFGKVPPMFQPAIEAKCQQEHIDLASAASGE